jgi:hypothetical protein
MGGRIVKAELKAELEIAWVESAPSLSEFRAIQTIIAAGSVPHF